MISLLNLDMSNQMQIYMIIFKKKKKQLKINLIELISIKILKKSVYNFYTKLRHE